MTDSSAQALKGLLGAFSVVVARKGDDLVRLLARRTPLSAVANRVDAEVALRFEDAFLHVLATGDALAHENLRVVGQATLRTLEHESGAEVELARNYVGRRLAHASRASPPDGGAAVGKVGAKATRMDAAGKSLATGAAGATKASAKLGGDELCELVIGHALTLPAYSRARVAIAAAVRYLPAGDPAWPELAELVAGLKKTSTRSALKRSATKGPVGASSGVKGRLCEILNTRTRRFVRLFNQAEREASALAKTLPDGPWVVRTAYRMRDIRGKEMYDQAILLVRQKPGQEPQVLVYAAVQVKSGQAKNVNSVVDQVLNDEIREIARPTVRLEAAPGGEQVLAQLLPCPVPTVRFIATPGRPTRAAMAKLPGRIKVDWVKSPFSSDILDEMVAVIADATGRRY